MPRGPAGRNPVVQLCFGCIRVFRARPECENSLSGTLLQNAGAALREQHAAVVLQSVPRPADGSILPRLQDDKVAAAYVLSSVDRHQERSPREGELTLRLAGPHSPVFGLCRAQT